MSDRGRDLYQWDGSDGRMPPVVPGQPADARFRDEVYIQPQPRAFRSGDNTMYVYGNVYIDQGGSRGGCRQRCDGRQEYYGSNYSYSQYCDPRGNVQQSYSMPYYEYGVRVYGGGNQGYDRSCYSQQSGWNGGWNGGGSYSRDSVNGGRGGYSADRTRYNGGGYAGSDPFDYALRGADAYFGYDIARRHADGQYRNGGYNGGWDNGYGGGWDRGYRGGWDRGYRGGNPVYVGPGGSYSRDSVNGGYDGYSADRTRANGGGYNGYNGYGGGDGAGQFFDFALRGADTYFGYDIARRHADGQYRDNGGWNGQNGGWNGQNGGGPRHQQHQQLQDWRGHRDAQRQRGQRGHQSW